MLPMHLRPARSEDWPMLLDWRNDPFTRVMSHQTDPVSETDHRAWLARKLLDSQCRMAIAEVDDVPVGVIRADWSDEHGAWLLSWTTAPSHRGKGYGRTMVQAFIREMPPGRLRAEVKHENAASHRIAQAAGLEVESETETLTVYSVRL